MYDRPTRYELLEAVRSYLKNLVIPAVKTDRRLYYQTLVAIHVLDVVGREVQAHVEHLHEEWQRLNFLDNTNTPPPGDTEALLAALDERNRRLCDAIAAGRYDYEQRRAALFEHLLMRTITQLQVANPQFLQALALEDEKRERLR